MATPQIDYRHVLAELSVNRKDPCEVIRELISNSYDAGASRIEVIPLVSENGFIFIDDGAGLSEREQINSITPYEAFFSIGRSTKIQGTGIGYKCQGSKLCFASQRFALTTRCKDDDHWRSRTIDNPRANLNLGFDVGSRSDSQPWTTLAELFPRPTLKVSKVLEYLNKDYFSQSFQKGTMLIVLGLDVDDFGKYFSADKGEMSYIWNYIRYYTRHGDVRVLSPDRTGFDVTHSHSVKKHPGYNDETKLMIWVDDKHCVIPNGWPYLSRPQANELLKAPDEISRLRDGRFTERIAKSFTHEGEHFGIFLAIDGNRRALEGYPALGRRGNAGCGIRLSEQRGTLISARGVKICAYNELFEHPLLHTFSPLAASDAQTHFTLVIDGNFALVTNRNNLSEASIKLLRSDSFVREILSFLENGLTSKPTFKKLVAQLRKESSDAALNEQCALQDELKRSVTQRQKFRVKGVGLLEDQWLLTPLQGEEAGVGALYMLLSHVVPETSKFRKFWRRPLTYSGRGVDSIAQQFGATNFAVKHLETVEYKFRFAADDQFNHPLKITDAIVCWSLEPRDANAFVRDDYGWWGTVGKTFLPDGIGYVIEGLENEVGDTHPGKIEVICLEKLIDHTFEVEKKAPPPPTVLPKKRRG